MEKLTMKDFENSGVLVLVTFLLAILEIAGSMVEPTYANGIGAFLTSIIVIPIAGWWLSAFWNKFLTKIFGLKGINIGLAMVLVAAITVLLG